MFNRIVCLNLDKRIHEQERLSREFAGVGLELEFFVCGDGHTLPAERYDRIDNEPPPHRSGYPAWANRPNSWNAFACYKEIIRKAQADNIEVLGLVEDDCHLLPNFQEVWEAANDELYNPYYQLYPWDMMYLCANHTWRPTKELAPHLLKLNGSGGFQFVLIHYSLFQTILDLPMVAPIDGLVGDRIHPTHNCYAVWPNIAVPLGGYSYCEGYYYDNIELYKNKGCP